MYKYPIKTIIFCLSFAIIINVYDVWKSKNKMDEMESRLTKLEIRVEKLCMGKC